MTIDSRGRGCDEAGTVRRGLRLTSPIPRRGALLAKSDPRLGGVSAIMYEPQMSANAATPTA